MNIKNLVPVKIKHTIKDFIRDISTFGISVAICHAGYNYFSYSSKSKQFLVWNERRKNSIMDFLEKELRELVLDYQNKSDQIVSTETEMPIWVFWWQGESAMPPIIQLCLESKKRNAGEHPIYVLDKHNYQDYISLPEYILDAFMKKKISIVNLSDIIRTALLAQYGGLWLDASIFCYKQIPESCFECDIYTIKHNIKDKKFISEYRWTTFLLGGKAGNKLYCFLSDAFYILLKKYGTFIDYFTLDYLINLAYTEIQDIHQVIENMKVNQPDCDELTDKLNENYKLTDAWLKENKDTCFYKIKWKQTFLESRDGELTYFGMLKRDLYG